MKKVLVLLFFCGLLAAFTAFAGEPEPVMSCATVLQLPGMPQTMVTTFAVYRKGEQWEARVTQADKGAVKSYTDVAEVHLLNVRAGLTGAEDPDELNLAENLVVAALLWKSNPDAAGKAALGFSADQVRSAKVYVIGKPTHMGLEAVVEAFDAHGGLLGAFAAPWGVSPCLK